MIYTSKIAEMSNFQLLNEYENIPKYSYIEAIAKIAHKLNKEENLKHNMNIKSMKYYENLLNEELKIRAKLEGLTSMQFYEKYRYSEVID